jgi:hypothetical protein
VNPGIREINVMKASCTLKHLANGAWSAEHASAALGAVAITAPTRDQAVAKLREELQYRIELCPCSGVSGDTVVIQITGDIP